MVTALFASRLASGDARSPAWFVVGTDRFCADIMGRFGARVLVKTGAEGVFCGAPPELDVRLAIECDDGAGRAAEAITAAMIARFLALDPADRMVCERYLRPPLCNWNGIEIGQVRTTEALGP
jgi:L-asparaginase II